MTGTGSYNPNNDRFVIDVTVSGNQRCELRYVRTGDRTRVTGQCDGRRVDLEA
jgi:hypothetical protein